MDNYAESQLEALKTSLLVAALLRHPWWTAK